MPFDVGINFRSSSGYVTDGTGETYCLGETYPTTRGGATFGWSAGPDHVRDRNATLDRRLAGANVVNVAGQYFRLDLPATGSYEIHLASGDAGSYQRSNWDLADSTTVFASLAGDQEAAEYWDASGVKRTAAAWPAAEVLVARTFTTTQFRLTLRVGVNNNAIAHIRVAEAAGAPVERAFAGVLAGVGSATLAVLPDRPLAATLAGVGSVTLAVLPERPLAGTLAGVGSATLLAGIEKSFAGVLAGTGSAVLAATPERPLAGTLAGTGSATLHATATATGEQSFTGALAGTGAMALDLAIEAVAVQAFPALMMAHL